MPDDSGPEIMIRPFARPDRDQLVALVNAHAVAVVPNVSISIAGLLSQLEREPGEFLVDPWVTERLTLVAEQRGRIVAAAHVLRYADEDRVSESYRGSAEIRWLLFWPPAPYWPDSDVAAQPLLEACLAACTEWGVTRVHADGTLPVPGVFGVPEQWPHIRALYVANGFEPERSETVHIARVQDIPRQLQLRVRGLRTVRSVGANGVRITGVRGGGDDELDGPPAPDDVLGFIEVDTALDAGSRLSRSVGWADIGNLEVTELAKEAGIDRWLVSQAADWLELGGVSRLLAYTTVGEEDEARALNRCGFVVLTRTLRGYTRAREGTGR